MKHELNGIFDKLEASLLNIGRELDDRPRAVLMISGHWEEAEFTVSSGAAPGMVYDYFGFPEYTYHIKYRAPGSPELAARIQGLVKEGGLICLSDAARGYDHGTFSLMKPLYPEENIPVVQLSMKAGFAPALHIRAGELLAPLRDEGVLIIGSGSSFHNLRARGPSALEPSSEFDRWLQETLVDSRPAERLERLKTWTRAPSARAAHPREDHLLPLMVAVGAAEDERGACVYHEDAFMGSWSLSSFRFGEVPVLRQGV
jgi:aromatic ring-opening dioxygenase catalytic subunit (LigB family)